MYNTVRNADVRYGTSQTLHPKPYIKNDENDDVIDEKHVVVVDLDVNNVEDDVSDR